jgi:hypothetical protein
MRQAFVLQLRAETDTARQLFVGVIEEVDTGRELRFNQLAGYLPLSLNASKENLKRAARRGPTTRMNREYR